MDRPKILGIFGTRQSAFGGLARIPVFVNSLITGKNVKIALLLKAAC